MEKRKKAAVIGAGLGGLSAAIHLAGNDVEVDLFEKGDSPGGKAGELNINGYRFDTGPSLLTMPFILRDIFDRYNARDLMPEIKPLDTLCRYFYPDNTIINAYSDIEKFAGEIEQKSAEKGESLKNYLSYSRRIYELTYRLFLFSNFREIKHFLNRDSIKTLFNLKDIDPFRTMHKANSSFFHDEKIIQLFDRYATYNGSDPFQAPATLNIIQHVEYNLGGYVALDGIHSIPRSLEKLARVSGVKINYKSPVDQIINDGKKAEGVVINGEERYYDFIVSNADVHYTFEMAGPEYFREAKKYIRQEPSSSALVFYWGMNHLSPELETHNILFAANYREEFEYLFKKKLYYYDPTVYIYISSKFNKKDAPEGKENWFVMINAPYLTGESCDPDIDAIRGNILTKIKDMTGIKAEKYIETEKILTPGDIQDITGSYRGSLYGISSNNRNAAFLRQKNKSSSLKQLYFCGGSAHPGGGIPLALLSGRHAAELAIKHEL